MNAPFTNIADLDRELLLNLPYADLVQACQVNQFTQALCKDPYFWKERLQREYGSSDTQDYEQQYRRLKEFGADPELYQKYSGYREAFKELFDDPELFYDEIQINPDYTLTDYAFEYDYIDSPFELVKHRLRKGEKITAGVYRQLTLHPDFSNEMNILARFAAQYSELFKIGRLFASNPPEVEITFKLDYDRMYITAISFDENIEISNSVPIDVGYELIEALSLEFFILGEDGLEF